MYREAQFQDVAQMKRERRFWPLSFELIAPTEPLLGTACVLPQPIATSGEKSSRKSGSNNYAARLLPSARYNNLIWRPPGKSTRAPVADLKAAVTRSHQLQLFRPFKSRAKYDPSVAYSHFGPEAPLDQACRRFGDAVTVDRTSHPPDPPCNARFDRLGFRFRGRLCL